MLKNLLEKLKTRSHNIVYAAFVPLADYRGSQKLSALFADQSLVTYLNTLFKMAITVGAIIAVLRMLYAGYMYMASDVWTSKETAKGIFRDVFLGLFLLLSIYIILSQINPNLLNLMPKIGALTPAEVAGPVVAAPASVAGCANCVPIPNGIPSKPPGAGCAGSGPCMVSSTMASKLITLTTKAISLSWWVTEAYPPTVSHSSSCHNNGTCIDANLIGRALPQDINQFITAASNSGLTAKWEVGAGYDTTGIPASNILVTNPPPNAPHFHITGG